VTAEEVVAATGPALRLPDGAVPTMPIR
jgi:hypothetical protein